MGEITGGRLRAPAWLAAVALAAAACARPESRIVATFRQGTTPYGFTTAQGGPQFYYASPTIAGGHLYIGTSTNLWAEPSPYNFFFKLDLDLREVWALPLGLDEVRGGAAVDAQGRIYFVVEQGRRAGDNPPVTDLLTCVSDDGRLLWQVPISPGGYLSENVGKFDPAIAADGTIYVGGDGLHAVAPDGSLRWRFSDGDYFRVMNAPAIDPAGNVYFAAQDRLYALAADGALRWSFLAATGGDTPSSPAFSRDHARVYLAHAQTVYAVDAATGAKLWELRPPGVQGEFRASPTVDDADAVYVGSKADSDSTLYAIGADGTLLWATPMGADLYGSPALGNDRTLYVGSERVTDAGERFHAVDMATGAVRWSVRLPGGDVNWSSPALVDGGTIYVGSMGGVLYAIRSDATGLLANAGWPRFHGGNASTGRRE